ncbi:MAG: hypothetical protein AAGD14_16910, partial [Planctomycetota bacterium]
MRIRAVVLLVAFSTACGGGSGAGGDPSPRAASFLWAGHGPDAQSLTDVSEGPDGSVVVTGWINRTVELTNGLDVTMLDPASGSLVVARFGRDGELLWARCDGGRDRIFGKNIALRPDGSCLVTGDFVGTVTLGLGDANETTLVSAGDADLFFACYESDGSLRWARRAGGSTEGNIQRRLIDDDPSDLALFPDGSFTIVGHFSIRTAFGEGDRRVEVNGGYGTSLFVAHFAPDGTLRWARGHNFVSSVRTRVIARRDGSCVVTGLIFEQLNVGGDLLRRTEVGWSYLIAFDAEGNIEWKRGYGRHADVVPWDMAGRPDGSFVVVGEIEGHPENLDGPPIARTPRSDGRQAFVAAFSADGEALWARKERAEFATMALRVATAANGDAVVTGSRLGAAVFGAGEPNETTVDSGEDRGSFFARYDTTGRLEWARGDGGPGLNLYTHGGGLTLLSDGRIALAGSFWNDVRFDGIPLRSAGSSD